MQQIFHIPQPEAGIEDKAAARRVVSGDVLKKSKDFFYHLKPHRTRFNYIAFGNTVKAPLLFKLIMSDKR